MNKPLETRRQSLVGLCQLIDVDEIYTGLIHVEQYINGLYQNKYLMCYLLSTINYKSRNRIYYSG